jgi:hypothetical protein
MQPNSFFLQVRPSYLARLLLSAFLLTGLVLGRGPVPSVLAGFQTDLIGPPGSAAFGENILRLPNGNIVVVDSGYDGTGPMSNYGAVYLYNGATGALISTLTGSRAGDEVGSGGVTVLSSGNFVVMSPNWSSISAAYCGAVTWGSATTGVNGGVSAANSLIGSTEGDVVGSDGLLELSNGNYVVRSSHWANGEYEDAGALTWGSGATGVRGTLSPGNSLVGFVSGEPLGKDGLIALSNGSYLVSSLNWDSAIANRGAVTWGDGTAGVTGVISAENSLIGTNAGDKVGSGGVTVLKNSNYVVVSPNWHNQMVQNSGAVTWGDGAAGVRGEVSPSNSLVGSEEIDVVGSGGVMPLSNGNYVVASPSWHLEGAVTWGSGTTGVKGEISAENSLVSTRSGDHIGSDGVTALSNGNYVVASSNWANGTVYDAGAVTWGNGETGIQGVVSLDNSLVGSATSDHIGYCRNKSCVTALSNGNYVVQSSSWHNGTAANVGAVTWGNGAKGMNGVVSHSNSLVGSTADDQVGACFVAPCVTALPNGNYVVASVYWHSGAAAGAGAVTWGNGLTGVKESVSEANSLVGSNANDYVGSNQVTMLNNNNYLVVSPMWHKGLAANAGAVTWGNAESGVKGIVSAANSLTGTHPDDFVGCFSVQSNFCILVGVTQLKSGNYVVSSPAWANGVQTNAGAVTWGNGTTGVSGDVSTFNSLVGSTAGDWVGSVTPLANGNFVVVSPYWDNGSAANTGAVTWGNGTLGVTGEISAFKSLVGTWAGDRVGSDGVVAINNGNYVVVSPNWQYALAGSAGAVTWGNGTTGISGAVSADNSLVGSSISDKVGSGGVKVLADGSYVTASPLWNSIISKAVGAVTWGNSVAGIHGVISKVNSLVGAGDGDEVGSGGVTVIGPSKYVVLSPHWRNGSFANAGAVTLSNTLGCASATRVGLVTTANSVLGVAAGGGNGLNFIFDPKINHLVVGRPADNIISLFAGDGCHYVFIPKIVK